MNKQVEYCKILLLSISVCTIVTSSFTRYVSRVVDDNEIIGLHNIYS